MKLKEYNADNSKSVSMGTPCLSVARKSGTISFNKGAVSLMGMTPDSAVTVSNDEDSPRDWYVSISKDPAAFKIRLKAGTTSAMFNCSLVAGKLIDAVSEIKRASLRLSKEPVVIGDLTYWLIITAKPSK